MTEPAVIDRYLVYLDEEIGRLVAAFPRQPNVMLVADHGQEATQTYPLCKGWHSRFGVFVAGGPNVPHRPSQLSVSYFDIVPTVLQLLGIEPAGDLVGRPLCADVTR